VVRSYVFPTPNPKPHTLTDRITDCKSLAPTWEKLATDFSSEPSVLIAKIDAEAENAKATAQSQGISGYPTIKFFPKGSTEPETYSGGRSEDDLLAFVNSKAGTHRLAGGSLSTTAGTIEAFDAVIAKFSANKDWKSAGEEVQKVAAETVGEMKEYYLKAIAKITGNPEYAMKEQTRLAGILKKGGLTAEKVDEMQRKSNVLAKFLVVDGESGAKSEL
jgi:protein disulfide-isomerase A6